MRLSFEYDLRGFGPLVMHYDFKEIRSWKCRTGSINKQGELINAIAPGTWTGREYPRITDEVAMVVNGVGWKWRLWDSNGNWTHYLIHPDGHVPGSLGCIVTLNSSATDLRDMLRIIMHYTEAIEVIVTTNFKGAKL